MEQSLRVLLESTSKKAAPAARIAAFAGVLPAQWKVMRQMQGTMSLVEGYSNLVMNELGAQLLPGFERLEEAYRARSKSKSILELLIWKLSGLDLKLQQYSRGEAFAKAVYEAHGMKALNLAWQGRETMPGVDELSNPEGWYRRVTTAPRSRR
jgi:putative hydrolase